MSKLTKLVKNPKLFFQDALKNNSLPFMKSHKKELGKKSEDANFNFRSVNAYKKIPHVIHTGEGITNGPSHLNLWIPEFLKSGEEFVILVRNQALFKWVKDNYSFVNVAYAKRPIDVENFISHMAYATTFYYLSNTGNLVHSLRYNMLQHVFLGHGDSDKAASAHKVFRVYDQIWVAGQAHIDRFVNAPFKTNHIDFVKVGRPALKKIIKNSQKDWRARFPQLRLLYLPTWEGVYEKNNYSSARLSAILLSELQKRFGVNIAAKFHPATGSRNPVLVDVSQKVEEALVESNIDFYIAPREVNVSELIIDSNIFICDISAVVSECIAANGPIFVYIPEDKEIIISNSNMNYEDYAYTFSTIDELCDLFKTVVIDNNDYLAEKRLEARDYLLSVNETLNDAFIQNLKMISSGNASYVLQREIE